MGPQAFLSGLPRRDRHGPELNHSFWDGGCGQILLHFLVISLAVGADDRQTLGKHADTPNCPVSNPPQSPVSSSDSVVRVKRVLNRILHGSYSD